MIGLIKTAVFLVCLSTTAILIYTNALNSPFVFDDIGRIPENPLIRMAEFSFSRLADTVRSSPSRPLAYVTFALNYYFHGYDVAGYHVVNLLVHILTGFLMFLVVRQTMGLMNNEKKDLIAGIASLVWIVNPVHTQSVTYIVQRMNAMSALFFLLALYLYIKGRLRQKEGRSRFYLFFIASGLSGVLALLSKQIAATLPVFILLYEWYFFQGLDARWIKKQIKWIGVATAAVLVIAGLYLGASPAHKILAMYDKQTFTMGQRLLTEPRVIFLYLSLIFFPYPSRLNLDYDFPVSTSLVDPVTTLVSIVGLIGLLAAAVPTARKYRLVSFALLWFLGNLFIESSFLGLALVFEHRTYLPSVFVIAALAWAVIEYVRPRPLAVAVLLAATAVWGFWTYQRNAVWADEAALWRDVTEKSPNLARPWNNLGLALKVKGKSDAALQAFKRSLNLDPGYAEACNNLGVVFQNMGQVQKAMDCFKRVMTLSPSFAGGHLNMGRLLLESGQPEQAENFFRQAIERAPAMEVAHYNLGLAFFAQNKLKAAEHCVEKALFLNPAYDPAHNLAGAILMQSGKTDQAIDAYRKALSINPYSAEAYNNLGTAFYYKGDARQATESLQKALAIDPDYAKASGNLSKIQNNLEQYGKAINALEKAVAGTPDDPRLLLQLGKVYEAMGMRDKALARYEAALRLAPGAPVCLNAAGSLYASTFQLEKAALCFERLAVLAPGNPMVHYNLACLYARQNRVEAAVESLQKAVDTGYDNLDHIRSDKDLDPVRNTETYRRLIKDRGNP